MRPAPFLPLPLLLTLTDSGSQFSVATADEAGCADLLEGMLGKIIHKKFNYIGVSNAAITLTWLPDVYEIISYTSQAFALFYAMQCLIALLVMRKAEDAPPLPHQNLPVRRTGPLLPGSHHLRPSCRITRPDNWSSFLGPLLSGHKPKKQQKDKKKGFRILTWNP